MYVTFFYPLDRSSFPSKWQREPSFYYHQFKKLLYKNKEKILVYSSDPEIEKICQLFSHAHFIFWERKKFWVTSHTQEIQKCLREKKIFFNVPEFFSTDYILLQLSKFEALYDASLRVHHPLEPIIWIDAGILYVKNLEESFFRGQWKQPGIHVTQFTSQPFCERWITIFPGAYLMGGCFGGQGVYVRRLFYESMVLLKNLWNQNISANDQQILSILHYRKPDLFHVQKAYTQWIPFYGAGQWSKALMILDSETASFYRNYQIYVCCLFCLYIYWKLYK